KAAIKTQEEADLVQELDMKSILTVPIQGTDRNLGAITLVTTHESGRTFTEDDLHMAQELARRAGLAIENARLYQKMENIARSEQEQSALWDTLVGNAPVGFAFV